MANPSPVSSPAGGATLDDMLHEWENCIIERVHASLDPRGDAEWRRLAARSDLLRGQILSRSAASPPREETSDTERLDWLSGSFEYAASRMQVVRNEWNRAHPNGGLLTLDSRRAAIDAAQGASPTPNGEAERNG